MSEDKDTEIRILSALSPDLSPKSIERTINTLNDAFVGEKEHIEGKIYAAELDLASALRKGLVEKTTLGLEIDSEDRKFTGTPENYVYLQGKFDLSSPHFFSKEETRKITDLISKEPNLEAKLETSEEGWQTVSIIKKLPDGSSIRIKARLGYPDQDTADKSPATDKTPLEEIRLDIYPRGNKEVFLPLKEKNNVSIIAAKTPDIIGVLDTVAQAINVTTGTAEKGYKVTGWNAPNTSNILVDKHGFILDSKSKTVGYILGGNYEEYVPPETEA